MVHDSIHPALARREAKGCKRRRGGGPTRQRQRQKQKRFGPARSPVGPQRHACVDHAVLGGPAARSALWPPFSAHVQSIPLAWCTHPPTAAPPQPRARLCQRPHPHPHLLHPAPTDKPTTSESGHLPTTLPFQTTSHHHHCDPSPDPAGIFGSPSPLLTSIFLRLTETCTVHAATAPPQRNETKASERRHRPATTEEEVRLESA